MGRFGPGLISIDSFTARVLTLDISYLFHIPYSGCSVDVLGQLTAHLFRRVGNHDERAPEEIQALRLIILGHAI